jgi:hypothetical protein
MKRPDLSVEYFRSRMVALVLALMVAVSTNVKQKGAYMKLMLLSAIIASFATGLLVIAAEAQSDQCLPGYVWREAFPGDHVCVTPETRAQAAYDNSQASALIEPGGGAYGPNTCRQGYVWREARRGDVVCVTPKTRDQTAYDNSQAKYRLASYDSRTFEKPRWNDYRLDWCLNWGTGCGQPAADNFCMRRRWTGALDFAADPNIGASDPTMVISGNRVCDQSGCTGFKYITCYGRIPGNRIFANPTISATSDGSLREFRLDECYTWDTGCGKRAANAFCSEKGFVKSYYHVRDTQPSSVDTLTIGTYEICDVNDYNCYGFQMIICQ